MYLTDIQMWWAQLTKLKKAVWFKFKLGFVHLNPFSVQIVKNSIPVTFSLYVSVNFPYIGKNKI